MSNNFPNIAGWIDGGFRLVIGFAVGMVLGYTAQLAEVSGWWFAAAVLVLSAFFAIMLANAVWALDNGVSRLFDWASGVKYPGGIKPAKNPAPEPKAHWVIRFGWVLALVLGAVSVYVLPEEVLAWLR